ncbi:MAG TPA: type IV toxin-antitoxin system AbiEi family antitoxin domain-containing protein [Conexibacter sp.]|nr:type IV toxin-antitoxin system AbiEi family antitoxin domain-containing protein [Conexibacter sp.]
MLAARQHGVVSRRQLLDAGFTARMVHRGLRSGRLLRLHPGVYAVGHAQLRREGRWLAAVLAAGPGAALSHRSAAALHGIREGEGAIDVTTTRRAAVRGVVVHRATRLDAHDVTTRSGVPVTTLPRTLVDLAGTLTPEQLGKLLREADRAGRLGAAVVGDLRGRIDGRRAAGAEALHAALAEHERLATSLTLSELEDRFLALLDEAKLLRPRTNHPVAGLKLDAAWPRERLAVELDGWAYHHDRAAFQADRARDARLTAAGWRVVRFTHADVIHRPAYVAGTLRETLAR